MVNVDLSARSLDLDALGQAMPGSSAGVSGRDSGVLPGLNLRLMAGELLAAGAIARDVEFSIGAAPACDE